METTKDMCELMLCMGMVILIGVALILRRDFHRAEFKLYLAWAAACCMLWTSCYGASLYILDTIIISCMSLVLIVASLIKIHRIKPFR